MPGSAEHNARGFRGAALAALRDRHFVTVALLLVLFAGLWQGAIWVLGLVLSKEPVPWAEGVTVNQDFQNNSFPEKLGPFEMVRDQKLGADVLESLKIGTALDKMRYEDRQSNWYFSRIYRDSRMDENVPSPYRLWSLQVFYYTGSMDTVPHVPDICAQAGGARALKTQERQLSGPAPDGPWAGPLTFQRTTYELKAKGQLRFDRRADYYIFSLNGEPESDRLVVRRRLLSPFLKHCYFAKIQFSPAGWGEIVDYEECDARAQEMLRHCLPEILKALPTAEDVERLES